MTIPFHTTASVQIKPNVLANKQSPTRSSGTSESPTRPLLLLLSISRQKQLETVRPPTNSTFTMSATANRIETYEDFVKVHGYLLAASGLPQSLHRQLFQKLLSDSFDGGSHFQIEPAEDGRQRRLVLTSDSMPENSDVFLIDHAWTFRLSEASKQVLQLSLISRTVFGCHET